MQDNSVDQIDDDDEMGPEQSDSKQEHCWQGQEASLENSAQKALDEPNEVELERYEVESESESSSEENNADGATDRTSDENVNVDRSSDAAEYERADNAAVPQYGSDALSDVKENGMDGKPLMRGRSNNKKKKRRNPPCSSGRGWRSPPKTRRGCTTTSCSRAK